MSLTAEEIVRLLDLEPLPQEGGFYRETYRADLTIAATALPGVYKGDRHASTAIYFLLTPEEFSALHRLPTDEVFHFYLGDPVEMLQLYPDGESERVILGTDLVAEMRPQVVVPGDTWQGCRLVEGGAWALLGCTVAPGFDFRDFHVATDVDIQALVVTYPSHATAIRQLAPEGSR